MTIIMIMVFVIMLAVVPAEMWGALLGTLFALAFWGLVGGAALLALGVVL